MVKDRCPFGNENIAMPKHHTQFEFKKVDLNPFFLTEGRQIKRKQTKYDFNFQSLLFGLIVMDKYLTK